MRYWRGWWGVPPGVLVSVAKKGLTVKRVQLASRKVLKTKGEKDSDLVRIVGKKEL